jgi:UDP-N-acetyl-D-mannosaminuronate dehydrogenase
VAGPVSESVARYFEKAGIKCFAFNTPETTEVGHILQNLEYAVNLAFADEKARICRQYGVDYVDAVMSYNSSYNHGFEALDHKSKRRMLLTPPNGHIGGHCLVQNAQMLAPALRDAGVKAPLVEMIEKYNQPK